MNTEQPVRQLGAGALYRHSRRIVLGVVAGQIVVALVVALAASLLGGVPAGYSALVGAGIGILPTYYLAMRMFKRSNAALSPDQALRNIYLGEGIKVIFTLALFVMAMRVLEVNLAIVAGAYVATVAVYWLAIYVADLRESPR